MFPKYKKVKKKFLFWEYETKIPDGWKDLGLVKEVEDIEKGRNIIKSFVCPYCYSRIAVGKEAEKIFRFCPRCMIKIKEINEINYIYIE